MRRKSIPVQIGTVTMGSDHPIAVQSMTNTDTADVAGTIQQIKELVEAGSELVRVTVNNDAAAHAVPQIKRSLLLQGITVPIIGDFHYNGHLLLDKYPECAEALDKYRINPGNVGFGTAHDKNFKTMIEIAIKHNKPVRIGVNWGSLDQQILTKLMDDNAHLSTPKSAKEVLIDALVESALQSAAMAVRYGLLENKIVLSTKMSHVQDMIAVYQLLAKKCIYALHLGLTEAGMGIKGVAASAIALGVLLQEGIGDTIRVSLTPKPGGKRTEEVEACLQILQTMGLRSFKPLVSSCPGCGRTTSTLFQEMTQDVDEFLQQKTPEWKKNGYHGVENMHVAVMGCIVNGPGESKYANIGISLPGTGEDPASPVYVDGKQVTILQGPMRMQKFKEIIESYVEETYHA